MRFASSRRPDPSGLVMVPLLGEPSAFVDFAGAPRRNKKIQTTKEKFANGAM
jgi:hypothetical protein